MNRLPDTFGALLHDGGINLLAIFAVAAYDAAGPPAELCTERLFPGARSVIVVGSGGRALWPRLTDWLRACPDGRFTQQAHPLDAYVHDLLERAEQVLAQAGIGARRFEAAVRFEPRLDFRRLGALCGLGCASPIGLLIHPVYGPWWALRGAWLVDCELLPTPLLASPCEGCSAPCRAAIAPGTEGTLLAATPLARRACHLSAQRYEQEQCVYHDDPDAGRAHLRHRLGLAVR